MKEFRKIKSGVRELWCSVFFGVVTSIIGYNPEFMKSIPSTWFVCFGFCILFLIFGLVKGNKFDKFIQWKNKHFYRIPSPDLYDLYYRNYTKSSPEEGITVEELWEEFRSIKKN